MFSEKVVIFIGTMGNGGAQRVISLLAPKLIERGLHLKLLIYYNQSPFYKIDDRVEVESVIKNTHTTNILRNIRFIRKYMRENADVVISFLAPFNMLVLFALLGMNIPVIAADRNDPTKIPKNRVVQLLRNILYNQACSVVVQTKANAIYFEQKCRTPVTVIYNPVDNYDEFGKGPSTPKENIIVTAGRLTSQKNHEMLIKSFKSFHDLHQNYRLVIFGEGKQREELERLVQELDILDCVSLPGSKTNVLELMLNAKLFVLTSYYEGMPNALIEAMCIGLPVISTKVSGATDLIIDGINGYLIEIDDIDTLSRHFCEMANDYSKYESIGIRAEQICEQLNIDKIADQWLVLIEKVSGKGV